MPVTRISKAEITEIALKAFLDHGIQPITIKQLASWNGVSTKTIHKLFVDKPGLVRSCLELHYSRFFAELQELAAKAGDEIESVINILNRIVKVEFEVNPRFYEDLNKFYPELQTEIGTAQNGMPDMMMDIIEKGKRNGLFLPDIEAEVCIIALQRLYQDITRAKIYADLALSGPQLVENSVLLYFRGMCTPLGVQKMQVYGKSATRQH
ncbi:TetR/AcrR family transcriptional regulator [Poritiphilus flavus]|uniref:HTH tetR-type domain-containing protein n=1 Tax=Poritiphilus flavus TaxID=2697053 RepID=A0A6L9EFK5_9FLAO|nr:TetR/AcrR family transcriptional regulator [Poritiphilus flavus]NAS13288.1 hypothetical protein [Poritiphilus flavus]